MYKNNYEVNVLVNGKPVREYYQNDRFFIEARKHTEYSIKLKNHGHKKIMAVVSVDGVEVLKGGAASEAESGYIVNPYSSTEIKGYRVDNDNVVTFKFDDGKKSYSTMVENDFKPKKIEKNGPSKNNGVIGVRIWQEKDPKFLEAWDHSTKHTIDKKIFYRTPYNVENNSINTAFGGGLNIMVSGYCPGHFQAITGCHSATASVFYTSNSTIVPDLSAGEYVMSNSTMDTIGARAAISNSRYAPKFELGTTLGKKITDEVIKVDFVKADSFLDLEIYYLTREELIKLGIDLNNHKKIFVSGYPKAFGSKDQYCKMPKNWGNE